MQDHVGSGKIVIFIFNVAREQGNKRTEIKLSVFTLNFSSLAVTFSLLTLKAMPLFKQLHWPVELKPILPSTYINVHYRARTVCCLATTQSTILHTHIPHNSQVSAYICMFCANLTRGTEEY
jgi:hypothetical protein